MFLLTPMDSGVITNIFQAFITYCSFSQAVLDMVDNQLLEQKHEQEKGYWQNIFHHLDRDHCYKTLDVRNFIIS
jgi:hypothetical protein